MSYTEMRSDKLFPYILAAKKQWLQTPISLQIGTTHTCINRCVMCQHWARDKKGPVKVLDVARLAENVLAPFSSLGGESVCYSGGESMEHPKMLDILALTHSLGLKSGVITSGAGQAFGGDLKVLNGCEWVRVSLDAIDAETYEASRGPGFAEVLVNLERMIQQGTRLGFGITVHKENIHQVGRVVDWIRGHVPDPQLESIRFWLVRGEARLEPDLVQMEKVVFDLEARKPLLELVDTNLQEFISRCGATPKPELLPSDRAMRCVVPLIHLYIDASLRGFPCCIYAGDAEVAPLVEPLWDFAKQSMEEVYLDIMARESAKHDYSLQNKKACAGCTLRLAGINRAYAALQPERHFI